MSIRSATLLVAALSGSLVAGAANAQFSIDWYTIDGGGGTSSGGGFVLSGTIGQPDAGAPMTGGTFELIGGFWAFETGAVSACSPADLTTDGSNPGDADYGTPDGLITVSDLTYFVEFWIASDLSVADVTTNGTNPGDANFGVPDGAVTVSDLTYIVELWIAGCP
ncbi:MAG: GC-type dockerin domain-anchored protein [Planctomycetota bacterium]